MSAITWRSPPHPKEVAISVVTDAARAGRAVRRPARDRTATRSRPRSVEAERPPRRGAFDLYEAQTNPFSPTPEYFVGNDYY